MSSRRPPSKRNAEYVDQRQSRMLQSMSPGTAGGRLASASPVPAGPAEGLLGESVTESAPMGDSVLFAWDEFTLAGATPTLDLTYLPVDASWHVALNGLVQRQGVDYTVTDQQLAVLTAMGALSGDHLDVRYAYVGSMETVPDDEAGLLDSFDRANAASLGTADSGQAWTQITGASEISSNKARFTTGVDGLVLADSYITDGTYEITIVAGSGTVDASLVFLASSSGADYLFAQLYSGASPGLRLAKTGGGPTGVAYDATLTITAAATYVVTVIVAGTSITVKVNGTTRISYTLTGPEAALFTGSYAGMRSATSDHTSTYNDLSVTV